MLNSIEKIQKIILFVLLAVILLQGLLGAQIFSAAMDEQVHLPVGYVHLKTKEIKFGTSSTPLVGMIAAIPSLFLNINFDVNEPYLIENNFWSFGPKFLFSNNADQLLFWGRLSITLLSVLLGFYVFKWAAEMFSPRAGLFSLLLYTFMPTIIAHSQFVSPDIGLSVFFFISFYYLWKFLKERKLKYGIFSGIFLGLALGAKFSAVLIIPLFTILVLLFLLKDNSISYKNKREHFLRIILTIFAIGFLVLWGIYFFSKDLSFYIKGMSLVYGEDTNTNYHNYLNGNFKQGGWWYYFLEAFLIKTPIPALVFMLYGILLFNKYKNSIIDKLFLLLPPISFFIITSLWAHNIGVRYLIPIYPFLFVYSGGIIGFINKKSILALFILLSSWYISSTITVYPNYISYFNEFIGGPKNGYKYLNDSNIEWGHDLKRLKKFVDKNPDTMIVYPWRQGNAALEYYGIKSENNIFHQIDQKENWWTKPQGIYAVSSHFLVRAKIISQVNNDKSLDWLSLYKPIDRIGQSFFIYKF